MGWQDRRDGGGSDWDGGGSLPHSPGEQIQKVWQLLDRSFYIGSFARIRIRIHITFLIYIVYELFTSHSPLWTLQWTSVLFASVLLHEFGHCFACRSQGGRADDVLLWPLGGLAFCDPPHTPRAHFITVAGGPAVNLLLALASWMFLRLWYGPVMPVSLHPMHPWVARAPDLTGMLATDLFVVNYLLLLFNLLLVFYPFDGGRLIQAVIWTRLGYPRSMWLACWIGMVGAGAVAIWGLFQQEMLLVFLAAYGGHISYQQLIRLRYEPMVDERFEAARWRQETHSRRVSRFSQWRLRRQSARRQRRQANAARHQAEVNRILEKVAREGLASLTVGEQRTLQRETKRQQGAG